MLKESVRMENSIENALRVKAATVENSKYIRIYKPHPILPESKYYTILGNDKQSTLLVLTNVGEISSRKLRKESYQDAQGMTSMLNRKHIILYFIDDFDYANGYISYYAQ